MYPYGSSSGKDRSKIADIKKAYPPLSKLRDQAREELYSRTARTSAPRVLDRISSSESKNKFSKGYPLSAQDGRPLTTSKGEDDESSYYFVPKAGESCSDSESYSDYAYSDTMTGSKNNKAPSYSKSQGSFKKSQTTKASESSYINMSVPKRPASKSAPNAASYSKYRSDCPECAAQEYYCRECDLFSRESTRGPGWDYDFVEYQNEAVATRRPGTLFHEEPLLDASPHLEDVRLGKIRLTESPWGCAQSPNGHPIWCILDSGAAGTTVSPAFLRRAFPGAKIFADEQSSFGGVGGGMNNCRMRVDLKMIWTGTDGREVLTNGEAWVSEPGVMEDLNCDVLLGLPYMRDNGMNLIWSDIQRRQTKSGLPQYLGDKLVIKGVKVEIYITR